ncbi:MAG: DNA polymerase, partial [candidate division WOR-3 bacterium]
KHELPRKILEYRELTKVASTYIDPLIELAKNGRVHTTFNQTGTATGRLSSSNPNLQNIPIRSYWGDELRKGFIAQSGFLLISADYSQIELRILAHITKDKNLIEAFKSGRDIHTHTASLIFNIPEDNVNEHQRRIAKVVNYGLIYGMSDYGLAQELGISREEAGQFIQAYYTLYPGVEDWRNSAIKSVEEKGYTETIFGRRRPIPEIYSENFNLKESAKRLAINTPIQGTAADLIKLAMIEVEKRLTDAKFEIGLVLSIHDELLFEIEQERAEEAKEIIKEVMENIHKFEVPIEVDIGIGKNWKEVH